MRSLSKVNGACVVTSQEHGGQVCTRHLHTPFAYAINKTPYVILYWFSVKITLCMYILCDLAPEQPIHLIYFKLRRVRLSTIIDEALPQISLSAPKTDYLKRSLSYGRAKLWNNLPYELRNKQSLSQFNSSLRRLAISSVLHLIRAVQIPVF